MLKFKLGPVAIFLLVVLGAVVLLAGYKTYDYVQHNPEFCTSCHTMDEAYVKWSESVHSQITCHDCHLASLKATVNQLYVYLTDPPEKPRHKPELENSICVRCHHSGDEVVSASDDGMGHWQEVLAEAGHREHVSKQKIQCIRCHSTSLHKFEPPEKICKECHKHTTLEKSAMDQHCTICHAFKAVERNDLKPVRSDCLGCHEFMQIGTEVFPDDQDNGMMHWECKECHKPHTKPKLGVEDCRQCHEFQLEESSIHNVEAHAQCTNCHRPHSWRIDHETSCLACHADREEHADGVACNVCHN